jgi:hypothetical protein
MSENTTGNKNVRDDEIDLLDLFRRMGKTLNKWFNAIGKAILVSIVFIMRRWLPLGLSMIAGVGLSYLLKTTSESSFTSDLVIRTNSVIPADLIPYINKLHTFCIEGNKPALINAISSTEEQVKNIIDISGFWIIDKNKDNTPDYVDYYDNHNVYDTVNLRMQDRLDIRVKIKTPQELSRVRDGIIKYIESDSLYQQKNRLRLRQNHEMLLAINYNIQLLDSLQKVKYFEETRNAQPKTGGQMVFLQEQKTQLIYKDIFELYSRKQALEEQRDLYKGLVTVLSEFSLPAKRDNGGIYYAKLIVPVFFFLTLLFLILLANRKKLKEIFNKY